MFIRSKFICLFWVVIWGLTSIASHASEEILDLKWPVPTGSYGTGTTIADWKHSYADESQGQLKVQVWYPVLSKSCEPAARAPYLLKNETEYKRYEIASALGSDPANLEPLLMALTASCTGAPVAKNKQFPLVIFSHGYWFYLQQNTTLMEELASRGYIVVSVAHPGDSMRVHFGNGTTVDTIPHEEAEQSKAEKAFWEGVGHAARVNAYPDFQDAIKGTRILQSSMVWRRDIIAVLDDLESGTSGLPMLHSRIDFDAIAFVGMSFGGATSALACHMDTRCKAAVNLDGFQFDKNLFDTKIRMPFLLMSKDFHYYGEDGPDGAYDFKMDDYFYEPMATAGYHSDILRVRVRFLRHLGFTDLPLAIRNDTLRKSLGDLDGSLAVASVNTMVASFLDHYLLGRKSSFPQSVLHKYPGLLERKATSVSDWVRRR